jgi:hypothetical protein
MSDPTLEAASLLAENDTERVEEWQSCRDRFGGVGRRDRASRGIPHLTERQINGRINEIMDHFAINVGGPPEILQRLDELIEELKSLREEAGTESSAQNRTSESGF